MIEITGLEEIKTRLKSLRSLGAPGSPIMAEIGNKIKNRISRNFENESYYNEKWKPLKDESQGFRGRKKGKRGKELKKFRKFLDNRKILVGRTKRLRDRWSVRVDDTSVVVGSAASYGVYHQGDASYPSTGKLPRRPFVPMDERGEIDPRMSAEIVAYLGKKIKERLEMTRAL